MQNLAVRALIALLLCLLLMPVADGEAVTQRIRIDKTLRPDRISQFRTSIEVTPTAEAIEGQDLIFTVRVKRASAGPTIIRYQIGEVLDTAMTRPPPFITIPEGESEGTVKIPTVDDDIINGDRKVTVVVFALTGRTAIGPTRAQGIIHDNDQPVTPAVYAIESNGDIDEGGMLSFTLTTDKADRQTRRIPILVAALDGSLLEPVASFIAIRPGQNEAVLLLQSADDTLRTADRSVTVTLEAADGIGINRNKASATALIRENDPEPVIDTGSTGGGTTTSSGGGGDDSGKGKTDDPENNDPGWRDQLRALLSENPLMVIAAIVALLTAGLYWSASRHILPRFYRVQWSLGLPQGIAATQSGDAAIMAPNSGFTIELGDALAIEIGDCPILSEEEHDDPDDRD